MRRVWAVIVAVGLVVVGAASPAWAADPRDGTDGGHTLLRDSAHRSPGDDHFRSVSDGAVAADASLRAVGSAGEESRGAPESAGAPMEVSAAGSLDAVVRGPSTTGELDADGSLYLVDENGSWLGEPALHATVGRDGRLQFAGLVPGFYVLRVTPDPATGLGGEYWQDALYWQDATVIQVGADQKRELGEIVLDPATLDVTRLAGADRFETAAAISYATFTDGPVAGRFAYVANGRNFPDALIAGPVAAQTGSALLLTETDSLPAATREELLRLRPEKVIVLGQEPSVSEAVRREIGQLTGVAVERIGGANRFETADALVRSGFEAQGAYTAFVVTGANFPDALSAGPVASTYGGPVVIAPPSGVTEREIRLLEDLDVSEIIVIGDEAAVSAASYQSLANLPDVTFIDRVGGRDRYDTAAQLNEWLTGGSDWVTVATGEKFPDALVGGVLAGHLGAAMVLTRQECIPSGGADFIERTGPAGMIIFGSEASVGSSVETLSRCS